MGASTGTRLMRDIVPDKTADGFEKAMAVGDTIFFIAADGDADSEELWRTDGTAAGTAFFERIYCVGCDRDTNFEASLNGLAIIGVHGGCCGARSLCRSDGTPEGTYSFDFITWGGGSAVLNGALYYFDRAFSLGEGTTNYGEATGRSRARPWSRGSCPRRRRNIGSDGC